MKGVSMQVNEVSQKEFDIELEIVEITEANVGDYLLSIVWKRNCRFYLLANMMSARLSKISTRSICIL
jgi:hypothetical protein